MDFGDGYSAEDVFANRSTCAAYTYDDIILLPGTQPKDVEATSLESHITKKIALKAP